MGPLSPTKRRHILGIITLLSVVVMWLSSSFLMNVLSHHPMDASLSRLLTNSQFLETCTTRNHSWLHIYAHRVLRDICYLIYSFVLCTKEDLAYMARTSPGSLLLMCYSYERITDPQTEVEDARRHSEEVDPA